MTRKAAKKPRTKVRAIPRAIPHEEVFAKWRKDPAFIKAHAELADEFALVTELIRA